MVSRNRKEFFKIIGQNYQEHNLPALCGWVEALLILELKDWTQVAISERLSQIFQEPDYSTSISSVNRALKILEDYGSVTKSGSRKTGYFYHLTNENTSFTNLLKRFIEIDDKLLSRLIRLEKDDDISNDSTLKNALKKYIASIKELINFFETVINEMK